MNLGERLGCLSILKPITLGFPYSFVAPFVRAGILRHTGLLQGLRNDPPDYVIASGRQASGVAAKIKATNTCIKTIFILNPYISPKHFDAVIVPRHDEISGKNVCEITGSLHALTPEKLQIAAKAIPLPNGLSGPYITVLIGGDSAHFTYTPHHLQTLRDKLLMLRQHMGGQGSFLITPSKRTRPELIPILQKLFANVPHILWDFKKPNPYNGFLGHANVLVVTSDSISMMSEACGVGVPVFVEDLGISHKKFQAFLGDIFRRGIAQPLRDENTCILYPQVTPLREMERVIGWLEGSVLK